MSEEFTGKVVGEIHYDSIKKEIITHPINMSNQLKWDLRFLEMAKLVSTWSKDPSTQVGAVLVNELKQVVGLGYNGFPRGVEDTDERYNNRELKYKLVVHAEVNAIITAGDKAKGATMYVYPSFALPPICNECAKVFIQAGVAEIVGFVETLTDERHKRWMESINLSKQMFDEAKIPYRGITKPNSVNDVDNLIKTYDEYIKFLGDELGKNAGFLLAHRITTSEDAINKGVELRKLILEAKNKIQ